MRLFLAIDLPPDVRQDVSIATQPLRDAAPMLGWATAPRLHLTLKFLGEQPAERLPEIEAAAAEVAARHRELTMTIGDIGAFPNFRRPRVVWIGVEQDPRLELLHHDLEIALQAIGFEVEGRPFRPHITLARVRSELANDVRRELSRAGRRITYRGECIVRSIDLMQSELTSAGAAYTTLHSAALRST